MLVLPFPTPAKPVPVGGAFAAAYSPNGLRQRPTYFAQRARPPQPVAFHPAPYSIAWGSENTASILNRASPANAGGITVGDLQKYLPIAAQVAAAYTEGSDPRSQVAVLRAKIRNYEKMKRTLPYSVVPGVLWYDNEIAKMRARLRAEEQKLALTREGEQATRQWRTLGQTAVEVGIVVGIAYVTFLTVATVQKARERR